MKDINTDGSDFRAINYQQCVVHLDDATIEVNTVSCKNLEDVLGGFGRAYQILAQRDVSAAYSKENPLIVSTGLLTGTQIMTGLRTYFSSYSPLKVSNKGLPGAMWSAASGKFGSKLRWTGIDEIIFEGRSETPVILHVKQSDAGPKIKLIPAEKYSGLSSHAKIMVLREEFDDCHFAVIGEAGENYQHCYFGSVGCSTENLMKSNDDKCRWAGRAGMGSIMGYKNVLGIIADSRDKKVPLPGDIKELNKFIASGPGSRKYREVKKGGLGGTWSNYAALGKLNIVPENNYRPQANSNAQKLERPEVEKEFIVKGENCFRCAIACHKNIYQKEADGSKGKFLAKFDYEPLNLMSTNLGIHDGQQAAELVGLCDNYGMDSISLGGTISYVLDYNKRHPDTPLLNGASFGDFEKIRELVVQTGKGQCESVGQGVKQLSESLDETSYAMHVKGLELPSYLPETNPGYIWAIAGGHMSMQTYGILAADGDTSIEYWVDAIVNKGLYMVRDDLTGICKFSNLDNQRLVSAIKTLTGLAITEAEIRDAVRNAFIFGLWLEKKQGFDDSDYVLPEQSVTDRNEHIKVPQFLTPEYVEELKKQVFDSFNQEIDKLCQEIEKLCA
ncbi:MAG: aldehyde:ferredoxin oxidoreductase [Proteobacteria bacterium]|nr:aldehyde:ferredoxin oxidoreductase [Pseudomonadota bacterium]NOG59636.1 aldehyde:ferredoxin oxidoreductase [Pseudomonadota bacterium]